MDWATAILLGLVGSLHCAGMCGPLALALPGGKCSQPPGLSQNAAFVGGRIAYNVGRIATYCFLGLAFGWLGKSLLLAGIQSWASIFIGAALFAGLFASSKLHLSRPLYGLVEKLKGAMAALLRHRNIASLGLLGLLNGLLPCGLVYVACAGATAAGSVLSGAAYMALFGAGTVPVMLTISLSGTLMPFAWRLRLRKAIPVSVFLLATLLILRGMSLGIPYVSPDLSQETPACCHK